MIGFVMMIGFIINHAILLVAAVRSVESTGLAALEEAIRAGLNQRLRANPGEHTYGERSVHCPWAVNPGPGKA